VIGTLMSTW